MSYELHPKKDMDVMPGSDLPPPVLVDTAEAFNSLTTSLMSETVIALDTESNSLYRYFYRVCLIQISIPSTDYLVDPLRLVNLSALGDILAAPSIQKVFHAAENDILMLKRDFGFSFRNVFDTMLASRILGWPHVGLASILRTKFGLTLDKRAQLTDWGQRPLTTAQLAYARLDSRFLLPLRELLIEDLKARRRWREAEDAFTALPQIEYTEKPFDPDAFWRIRGARDLKPVELAVLRELYLWRDEQARAVDRPPFKVLGDDALLSLALQRPHKLADLRLSARQVDHYGRGLLAAIARGLVAPVPLPPARPANGYRHDPQAIARFDRLRAWRAKRAAERAVDTDIIATNEALMTIARAGPTTMEELAGLGVLGAWKLEEYGEELLQVFSTA
jgi:ribonuclease D